MTSVLAPGESVMTQPIIYAARGMSKKIGVPVIPGTNTPLTDTLFPNDAYRNIALAGITMAPYTMSGVTNLPDPIDLGKYITDASVDMSWDAITQITMKLEDPGLTNYKANYFSLGNVITFNGIQYVINDVSVDGGSSGLGGITVKCRSKAIQDIKNRQGVLDIPTASFTDFILHECKAVNASMYGQATPIQSVVSRLQPQPGQSGEGTETASSWTTFESFAQDSGFVLYESNGAIFFGQPTWLFDNFAVGNGNIGVYWQSRESAFPNTSSLRNYEKTVLDSENYQYDVAAAVRVNSDRFATGVLVTTKALFSNTVERWDHCISVPEVEVAYDQGPISNYTVNFEVPLEFAWSYWIGRRVIVRGMGMGIEAQPLMVTAVSYSLAGTGTCQVTAQTPINPSSKQKAVTVTSGSAVSGQYANAISPGRYGKNTYNQKQITNAIAIYNACMNYSAQHPEKHLLVNDILIALMTAITESSLINWANPDLPSSYEYTDSPNQAPKGAPWSDHSLGLFQQRDSWGTIKQRMTPATATVLFLQRELVIPNRLHMLPGEVCQAVQVSAYPDAYQKYIGDATALVQALSAHRSAGSGINGWKPGHPVGTKLATDFVNIALQMVGKPYSYGANYPNLTSVPAAFDCSSLVQWAAYQVGVQYPRDTASQWPWIVNHRTSVSVAEAAGIRGAVLFRDPFDSDAHTAISLGNGNTVQAYDTGIGVIANQTRTSIANQGFNYAALIPNMVYPAGVK